MTAAATTCGGRLAPPAASPAATRPAAPRRDPAEGHPPFGATLALARPPVASGYRNFSNLFAETAADRKTKRHGRGRGQGSGDSRSGAAR